MPDGGFVVKFDEKEVVRCYRVAFDYDDWTYTINTDAPKPFPELKSIAVVPEEE